MKKEMVGFLRFRCNNFTAKANRGDVKRKMSGKYCVKISSNFFPNLARISNIIDWSTRSFVFEKA